MRSIIINVQLKESPWAMPDGKAGLEETKVRREIIQNRKLSMIKKCQGKYYP